MDSVSCSLEGKPFQLLVSGLCKSLFYGETEAGIEDLYQNTQLDRAQIVVEIGGVKEILTKAAEYNWESSILEDKVQKVTSLSPDNIKILAAIWGNEKDKIHKIRIKESRYNNSFKNLHYRVDLEAMSKDNPESGEPVALFEFNTTNINNSGGNNNKKSQFSMNRQQVNDMVAVLDTIQKKFDSFSY